MTTLTPWEKCTPLAIPQQMLARVKQAQDKGHAVHIVGCVIERNPNGNYTYSVTNSPMPAEIALMASYEVGRMMRPR